MLSLEPAGNTCSAGVSRRGQSKWLDLHHSRMTTNDTHSPFISTQTFFRTSQLCSRHPAGGDRHSIGVIHQTRAHPGQGASAVGALSVKAYFHADLCPTRPCLRHTSVGTSSRRLPQQCGPPWAVLPLSEDIENSSLYTFARCLSARNPEFPAAGRFG